MAKKKKPAPKRPAKKAPPKAKAAKPRPAPKPKAPKKTKPATVRLAQAKAKLAKHPKKALIKAKVESRAQSRGVAPGLATALISKPLVAAPSVSAPAPSYQPDPEATEEMEPEVDEQTQSEEIEESETEEEQTTPEEYDESDSDIELGFVGAVASAAPAALKAVGKIGKVFKKKKKKKSKVTQMPVMNIEGSVPSKAAVVSAAKQAIAAAPLGSGADDASLVRAIVAAVPGPVRDVVLEALNTQAKSGIAKEAAMEAIAGQVDESLKPQIAAMLAAIQAQQLSNQATYEHESLVADANFRNSVTSGLGTALAKLEALEKRLGSSAVVSASRVPVFGGRNVLEGR